MPDETFGGDGCSHYLDVHMKTYQIVPFNQSSFLCQLYSIELSTKILWKDIVFNVCYKMGAGLSTAKMERLPYKAGWPMKRLEIERIFLHFHLLLLSNT